MTIETQPVGGRSNGQRFTVSRGPTRLEPGGPTDRPSLCSSHAAELANHHSPAKGAVHRSWVCDDSAVLPRTEDMATGRAILALRRDRRAHQPQLHIARSPHLPRPPRTGCTTPAVVAVDGQTTGRILAGLPQPARGVWRHSRLLAAPGARSRAACGHHGRAALPHHFVRVFQLLIQASATPRAVVTEETRATPRTRDRSVAEPLLGQL